VSITSQTESIARIANRPLLAIPSPLEKIYRLKWNFGNNRFRLSLNFSTD
jgi:hypothetical protein